MTPASEGKSNGAPSLRCRRLEHLSATQLSSLLRSMPSVVSIKLSESLPTVVVKGDNDRCLSFSGRLSTTKCCDNI